MGFLLAIIPNLEGLTKVEICLIDEMFRTVLKLIALLFYLNLSVEMNSCAHLHKLLLLTAQVISVWKCFVDV